MPLYFAYGSNMSSARLRARVGDADVVSVASLPDHRHCFDKHGVDGSAKGNIMVVAGSRVLGVVYQLDDDQLSRLRVFEGGYRQVELRVDCGRQWVIVASFVAIAPVTGLAPTDEYLRHYHDGMREHGLPDEYQSELLGIYSVDAR